MTASSVRPWDHLLTEQDRVFADRYVRNRRFGTRPALLLIDLYVSAFGDGPEPLETAIEKWPGSCGPAAWEALDPLLTLLGTAREAGVPIAHTSGEDRPESTLGAATARRQNADETGERYRLMPQFTPVAGELLVRKTRASAFFGTPLSTWLRQRSVDSLVVAGESTSGCVRASVVDAYSHGFQVAVVEDAVFDRSPVSHAVNLLDMHRKYATVVDLGLGRRCLQAPSHDLLPAG
ncbi:cysteine hydrolase family protein [Egicoccus sp. AB-alg2]|uniref:cysteine hydrolase family protein n=1 Tax=Egicoccus sp. AB-alg2 TaxID=3242693 RepID=UPI00359D14B5